MSTLRLFIVIVFISLFTVGCGITQPGASGPIAPTLDTQPLPSATPESLTPTPTLPPAGQEMLGAYPMALNASWSYNLVLDYDSQSGPQHFEGEITETIIEATPHMEAWVFRSQITNHPMFPNPDQAGYYYTMIGSGLYQFSDQESAVAATNPQQVPSYAAAQILAWPLELGQMFGDPALITPEGRNVWRIESDAVTIDVPAGHFEQCFILSKLTNPDDSHRWFCPGTGIVMYEYHHHGSRFDEIWTLLRFTPGS